MNIGHFLIGLTACTTNQPEENSIIRSARQVCSDLHDEPSCHHLAQLYEDEGRIEESSSVLEASCERGNAISCGKYGILLVKIEPSTKEAIPYFTTACKSGIGLHCYYSAELTSKHHSHAAAMPLYEKGCQLDNIESCTDLASYLIAGDPEVRDEARGMTILDRQCSRMDPHACETIGNEYRQRDLTLPENFDLAYSYFHQACELASEAACNVAGQLQHKRDAPLALKHYEAGCTLGEGSACYNAALLINTSDDIAIDEEKTVSLLKHGCELESPDACEMYQQYLALPTP